jgi:ATP-dependent DNA helicase RecQ
VTKSSDQVSKVQAQQLLEQSIGQDADFRPHQWEAIEGLVNKQERQLLVQRTGWGKSTVYFIATKLLRERGAGPTLIISPLLALMRNQIEDAEQQLGLDAWTINSNNTEEWDEAKQRVVDGQCDILLISPERLSKQEFREQILIEMEDDVGLLVIDEAHCISDWGHDFRPDYRRIRRILQELPSHIPVAATTATANDRVVDDVTAQIPDLRVIRGALVRDSLRIQTITMDSRASRLAWLAENLDELPSAGIVYCLTTDEVEMVAKWLTQQGFTVKPYHGGMDGDRREGLEAQLLANDVDALVATNALGMGFNKPDLGWVVHFQRPPNLIRYYQEIGRAGRGLDEAYAIMLSGEEDDEIAEYFILVSEANTPTHRGRG